MEKKTTAKVSETKVAVKPAEKKAEVKVEAAKVEVKEVAVAKEVVKAVEKKVEEKAAVVKETAAKKAPAKKPAAKKATAAKEEVKPEIFVQFANQEAVLTDVIEKVKKQFVEEGHKASSIKSVQVYLKPEDYSAYYVINGKNVGRVDLF